MVKENVKISILTKFVFGFGAIAAAFFMFAPEERVNALSESIQRARSSPEILCLDYQRKELKDPDSARLVASSSKIVNGESHLTISIKAKNSYGAYGTLKGTCVMTAGKVNEAATYANAFISSLQHNTACLEMEIEARRAGAMSGPSKCSYEESVRQIRKGEPE